jgi:L,D-transpeptidase ErfK/SrfK
MAVSVLSMVIGCTLPEPPPPPAPVAAPAPVPLPPLYKVNRVPARVPGPDEVPGLVGRLQRHRLAEKETVLDIALAAGVGFRALRAANPILQQYVPRPGTELVVPTRFVLPRSGYRGLVVSVAEMRLYKFPADTEPGEHVTVMTWPIGIGAEVAQSPTGRFRITSKDANPTWVVPDSIYAEMDEPRKRVVPPGPDNPLGAFRIRTSIELYAFHGTNDQWTVGRPTTHGCIRLYDADIAELYGQVDRGYPGEFVYQPVKVGEEGGRVYLEVHPDVYRRHSNLESHAMAEIAAAGLEGRVDRGRVRKVVGEQAGIPEDVTADRRRASNN